VGAGYLDNWSPPQAKFLSTYIGWAKKVTPPVWYLSFLSCKTHYICNFRLVSYHYHQPTSFFLST